jgi:hypothetical protein
VGKKSGTLEDLGVVMAKKSRHNLIHYLLVVLLALTRRTVLIILFAELTFLGYLVYWRLVSPVNIVVAVPLVLIGISMILINFWELLAAIFSLNYSRTHCPFCLPSKDPQKILSLKNGRVEEM